jgi:hypothetical protein
MKFISKKNIIFLFILYIISKILIYITIPAIKIYNTIKKNIKGYNVNKGINSGEAITKIKGISIYSKK